MPTQHPVTPGGNYDVVICGGGLAGQTLARQLKLNNPMLSILMIIKSEMPLAWNDFKVGESTVEISAFYFSEVLQLQDYFKNNHYKKFGFRYFIGDSTGLPASRPEIGLSSYAPYDSFQIDRGVFESDLYFMNLLANVTIISGASVKSVALSDSGGLHTITYQEDDGKTMYEAQGRWVVDASGRRCLIQRSLGLQEAPETACNATWWRVKGRLDVDDLVPRERAYDDYFMRVANRSRFYSTTHLMNKGYWVWLIPLASGHTSVGIVTTEAIHPFDTYNTYEKSMKWLNIHEPVLYTHMQQFEIVDFLKMKNYSYGSKQVFSTDRWACTGEAGLFTDPYYSPGSNFIAFENSMITRMITDDINGEEDWKPRVAEYNDFIINMNKWLTRSIQSSYTYFHLDIVIALSFIWDVAAGWSFICPRMFNSIYLTREATTDMKEVTLRFFSMAYNVEDFFNEWKQLTPNNYTFSFIDYLSIPFLRKIYDRNVKKGKSTEQLKAANEQNLVDIEIFAQCLFWIALEDVYPEMTDLVSRKPWLNAWAITLDISSWNTKHLFSPDTPPADISETYTQLKSLFINRHQSTAAHVDDFNYSFK
ncbi:FAD-dependent oxidoreductase [Chitinophaga polysaccharea]|uniref:NAD(P)/FAD-dependent oxidoreductase n=1 Tax=Chitinophaga polysaccharea TaxID=1293035 RepID=UPI001455C0FE|nr:FAD-dependent oxidoreductase [Chitinophaga polysaccharea]NLR62441.1 FAD-dependent oxidoreductase [Chitinophaga polysaccharea]